MLFGKINTWTLSEKQTHLIVTHISVCWLVPYVYTIFWSFKYDDDDDLPVLLMSALTVAEAPTARPAAVTPIPVSGVAVGMYRDYHQAPTMVLPRPARLPTITGPDWVRCCTVECLVWVAAELAVVNMVASVVARIPRRLETRILVDWAAATVEVACRALTVQLGEWVEVWRDLGMILAAVWAGVAAVAVAVSAAIMAVAVAAAIMAVAAAAAAAAAIMAVVGLVVRILAVDSTREHLVGDWAWQVHVRLID